MKLKTIKDLVKRSLNAPRFNPLIDRARTLADVVELVNIATELRDAAVPVLAEAKPTRFDLFVKAQPKDPNLFIGQIKAVREVSNLGLKEAKEFVESLDDFLAGYQVKVPLIAAVDEDYAIQARGILSRAGLVTIARPAPLITES